MPSKAYTSAGTQLFISEQLPADTTISDFDLVSFTEVGEVSDIAEFGSSAEVLTYYALGSNVPEKSLGNLSVGNLTLTMAAVRDDTGQAIIQQARRDRQRCSFQIITSDPDVYYFTGLISDYSVSIGGPDQIVSASVTIALDSEFVVDSDIFI